MFELTLAERFEMAWDRQPSTPSLTIEGITLNREFLGEAQFITRPGVVSVQKTDDMYLVDAISDALRFK